MEPLDILTTFDSGYAKHWPSHAMQVIVNSSKPVNLHMIVDDVNAASHMVDNVGKIAKMLKPDVEFKFFIHDISDYSGIRVNERMPDNTTKWITDAAYWRLYASEMIDADKVLYVDLDTLIRHDFASLFDIDMHGADVAMGLDFNHRDGYIEGKYCAGVQLIDLDIMRKRSRLQQMHDWSFSHKFRLHDQSIVNACLDICKLDSTWQCSQYSWWKHGAEPIDEDPNIVHFIYRWKPWKNLKVEDRTLFDEWQTYMKLYDSLSAFIESGKLG